MKAGIKVFAPASVANLACGYDILGLALEEPGDELILRPSDKPGLKITKITGDGGQLPRDVKKNTASYSAFQLLKHLGAEKKGFEMELHKNMPLGSGLGSSAASAAAGVMAVNEMMGRPLSKEELLPFAVRGEQVADGAWHADNVAPSLLGGIIFIRDNDTLDVHRLPVPRGLYVTVIHPHIEILTRDARAVLLDITSLDRSIRQSGNLGGFIISLYNSDFDLLSRSLEDVIIEPQRSHLIPYFYEAKTAALENGALGCSISGAGPSIFALSINSLDAERCADAMAAVYADQSIGYDIILSPINQKGTYLL